MSRDGSAVGVAKRRAPSGRLITNATLLGVFAIVVGWATRHESNLVAREGAGYVLGIFGLVCMSSLLLYSLRKRVRWLRSVGRISTWFQIHMLLGLVGPVAILYHCGFHLGSLNSNVALACALVVAASGVVGRVIYTRIHHGLSEHRTTLAEIREDLAVTRRQLEEREVLRDLWEGLERFEERISGSHRNAVGALWARLALGHRCRVARRHALRLLRRSAQRDPEVARLRSEVRDAVKRHVAAVRRCETLETYERVFALWHVLHLPLTFLLYLSAVVHVVAVNLY